MLQIHDIKTSVIVINCCSEVVGLPSAYDAINNPLFQINITDRKSVV